MKRRRRIDLGLAISALHSKRGVPRGYKEIAAYCDCSWQRIHQIEQGALRKIRVQLYRDKRLNQELMEEKQ